jgi:hypothetical protein
LFFCFLTFGCFSSLHLIVFLLHICGYIVEVCNHQVHIGSQNPKPGCSIYN